MTPESATESATDRGGAREARDGAVFDIGYQRYTGSREGRLRSRFAVVKDGVRTALGLGRGARAKIFPWSFIGLLTAIGLVMALIAGAADRIVGPGMAEQLDLPSHADYYSITAIILFLFAAVVAPKLLCTDRRERVIDLYLVRPLTGPDYVFSRWGAFLVVMIAAAWLPQLVLFAGLSLGAPAPVDYALAHWLDVPRFLLAGAVVAIFATTLATLVASFTTRRAYASVFLVGLFVIVTPFVAAIAGQIEGEVGRWIAMFNLVNIPLHVNDLIFGQASELTGDAPSGTFPASGLVGWYLAWVAVPAGILWWRFRRAIR